ncbi:43022_t:CDS:2 [Gigaspora margarita]|uniref:43022_t:CDS:1 n=1 Tax=Gigaspora margarita TaxID=4874 RepID=A0ABN7UH55_GIGMA|nr:43022_t:CDS:2 [Gigaspora margarita]
MSITSHFSTLTCPKTYRYTFKFKTWMISYHLFKKSQRYKNSIAYRSFLYEPPKEERLDISLEFSTAKEVLPLLHAIRTRDQQTTWKIYQELQQERKLHLLSPQQHSIVLKSFDVDGKYPFTRKETTILKKKLFYIFDQMKEIGHDPSVIDYSHMMNVFSRIRLREICDKPLLKKVNNIITSLKKSGLKPNLTTYAMLVRLYFEARDIKSAQQILEFGFSKENYLEIEQHKWAIVRAFKCMMKAYGYKGDLKSMDECYRHMLPNQYYNEMLLPEFNVTPNATTFQNIIYCLCEKGKTRECCRYIEQMKEQFNILPTEKSIGLIYNTMMRKKRVEDANVFAEKWKIPNDWYRKSK